MIGNRYTNEYDYALNKNSKLIIIINEVVYDSYYDAMLAVISNCYLFDQSLCKKFEFIEPGSFVISIIHVTAVRFVLHYFQNFCINKRYS